MGASEKVAAAMHGAPESPWTDEDVEAATHRTRYVEQRRALVADVDLPREYARVAAAALAPRVAELQRAAKVEALREAVRALDTAAGSDSGAVGLAWARSIILSSADEIERGER